jgi:hypothetical protein
MFVHFPPVLPVAEITDRFFSTQYAPRPVHGLADYSSFGYLWTPYTCKPQHRSFDEWIDVVKPERLVVFGDSVMRDLFCQQLNAGQPVCECALISHSFFDDVRREADGFLRFFRPFPLADQMFGEYEQSCVPLPLYSFLQAVS